LAIFHRILLRFSINIFRWFCLLSTEIWVKNKFSVFVYDSDRPHQNIIFSGGTNLRKILIKGWVWPPTLYAVKMQLFVNIFVTNFFDFFLHFSQENRRRICSRKNVFSQLADSRSIRHENEKSVTDYLLLDWYERGQIWV